MRRLVIATALALLATDAGAADTAKMEAAEKELVKLLTTLDGYLSKAATSSGASSLRSAGGMIDDIERRIDAYEDAADGDREGETNVKEWRYVVAQVDSAIRDLIVIQAKQFEQDQSPRVCTDAETKLKRDIEAQVKAVAGKTGDDVEKAIKEIEADAEALEKMVTGGVARFDENLKMIDRKADELKGFRANNDTWDKIDDELGIQAAAIHDYYQDANRKVHGACAKIMAGKDNPDVKAIVLALSRGAKTVRDAAAEALEDYNNWLKRLQVTRQWHEEGEEAIRKALCAADEGTDDVVVLDPVEDVVKDVVRRLDAEWTTIEREGNDLLKSLKDPKLLDDVRTKLSSIGKSLKTKMLKGANNPVIRTRMEIGKKGHSERQSQLCPGSKEIELPNKKRIDCVLVKGTTCEIVEIKPDTISGMKRALGEANDYMDMVQGYFDDDPTMFDDKSKDIHVFKPCIVGKKINLRPVSDHYKFCPAKLDVDETDKWDVD